MKGGKTMLEKILNCILLILTGIFVVFIGMVDNNIKFWPFVCLVMIPVFLLGFLWSGIIWVVLSIYMLFLVFRSLEWWMHSDISPL